MSKLVNKYFPKDRQIEIEKSVQGAEQKTAGEILPVVVEQSSSYFRVELMGSLILSMLLSLVGLSIWILASTELFQKEVVLSITSLPLIFFGFLIIVFFVSIVIRYHWAVKKFFIPASLKHQKVFEAAENQFYKQRVFDTRDRTGVLIYLSLREKQVVILADKGINEKVPEGYWDERVKNIVEGLHQKRAVEALCKEISVCGQELSIHFPIKEDDTDELKNAVFEQ